MSTWYWKRTFSNLDLNKKFDDFDLMYFMKVDVKESPLSFEFNNPFSFFW